MLPGRHLLFCSTIILESMLSDVLIIVKLPKRVHKYYQGVAEAVFPRKAYTYFLILLTENIYTDIITQLITKFIIINYCPF